MDFSHRSAQPELMDDATIRFEEFKDCLCELETINGWTLAYRPTLQWLARIQKKLPTSVTIFDVGSGGGDMLRRIWKRFDNTPPTLALVGLDITLWSKQMADAWTPAQAPITHETCNIFLLDDARRADLIISSLFTHHLTDTQLVTFLRWMEHHATHGWFINDLHRHPIPYYFIRLATRLFSRNRLIQHDAAVSVTRAFTRADWERLLAEAGIACEDTRIRWMLPFRYCVERIKT